MHLHLTFSGLMCILSLQGRQEHCPFTTRLRVLKLEHAKDPVNLINGHACRDLLTLGVLFLKGRLDPQ